MEKRARAQRKKKRKKKKKKENHYLRLAARNCFALDAFLEQRDAKLNNFLNIRASE